MEEGKSFSLTQTLFKFKLNCAIGVSHALQTHGFVNLITATQCAPLLKSVQLSPILIGAATSLLELQLRIKYG